jgi:hypothetical protein
MLFANVCRICRISSAERRRQSDHSETFAEGSAELSERSETFTEGSAELSERSERNRQITPQAFHTGRKR